MGLLLGEDMGFVRCLAFSLSGFRGRGLELEGTFPLFLCGDEKRKHGESEERGLYMPVRKLSFRAAVFLLTETFLGREPLSAWGVVCFAALLPSPTEWASNNPG